MDSTTIGMIVFICVFGGAMIGMRISAALPDHHLSADSKDIVKLGMGLVGTMTALLLGLLVASAKGSYETEKAEITEMSAKIIFLDRVLDNYGEDAMAVREILRNCAERAVNRIWPEDEGRDGSLEPTSSGLEGLYNKIHELNPMNETQKDLKSSALDLSSELGQMRWLLFEQSGRSIPTPFLVVVIFWLTVIFISFGLMAPRNSTVIITLLICAMSVSGAIGLIMELDRPFDGLIQISSRSMRDALTHLGR